MNKEQKDVAKFHEAMDQHIGDVPKAPPPGVVHLRARLVTEEFGEFIGALAGVGEYQTTRLVNLLHETVRIWFGDGNAPNLPDLADAIGDLKYVLEGTNLAFGIDGEPVWDAIQKANMAKVGGGVDAHGKRMKPPGWTPPDIARELLRQGWEPSRNVAFDDLMEKRKREHEALTGRSSKKGTESDE